MLAIAYSLCVSLIKLLTWSNHGLLLGTVSQWVGFQLSTRMKAQQYSFIHSFIFHFMYLQVQPKDVEIVIKCCTMYLLNYRCQMTEYSYNTLIT
jgi:hypothetical protein